MHCRAGRMRGGGCTDWLAEDHSFCRYDCILEFLITYCSLRRGARLDGGGFAASPGQAAALACMSKAVNSEGWRPDVRDAT